MGALLEMSAQGHRRHPFGHKAILFESSKTDRKIQSVQFLPVGLS